MPSPISRRTQTFSRRQALLLGLLHGPAELLPISSSGHLGVVPWLLGWRNPPEPGLRKAFDVALHGGATAGWLMAFHESGKETLGDLSATSRRPVFLVLAVGLPGAAGAVLEEPIERRLGTPGAIAAGLLVGSLVMLAADRTEPTRAFGEGSAEDGLWMGLAQASALFPGVSRSGAALAVARIRGWGRQDSQRLSRALGLPVIAGATVLKGLRMFQRPPEASNRQALAIGAGASFASAWLLAPLLGRWAGDSLTPYAVYRLALALAILARERTGV